jgi:protein-disulfide isomerase
MTTQVTTSHLSIPVSASDHAQGRSTAPVTLVEYGDYQCPFCGQAYPIVKALQKRLGDQLRFVFRNFPLEDAHPHAVHAAMAAEAAAASGGERAFWAMHDALLEHQDGLDDTRLARYAASAGVAATTVTDAITSNRYADRIEADLAGGVRSGVNGTPTFFINGTRYDGDWTDEAAFGDALSAAAREGAA